MVGLCSVLSIAGLLGSAAATAIPAQGVSNVATGTVYDANFDEQTNNLSAVYQGLRWNTWYVTSYKTAGSASSNELLPASNPNYAASSNYTASISAPSGKTFTIQSARIGCARADSFPPGYAVFPIPCNITYEAYGPGTVDYYGTIQYKPVQGDCTQLGSSFFNGATRCAPLRYWNGDTTQGIALSNIRLSATVANPQANNPVKIYLDDFHYFTNAVNQ